MGKLTIADVGECVEGSVRDILLRAIDESVDVAGRSVERLDIADAVSKWSVDHGRAQSGYGEAWLICLDVVKDGSLGECLRGEICHDGVAVGLLDGDGVPVCLLVDISGALALHRVQNRSKRRSDDDSGDGRVVLLGGLEDGSGAPDSGLQELLFEVGGIQDKWRRSMDNLCVVTN